jgi:ATP-binding cassette subfamily B multidrug efflux pump
MNERKKPVEASMLARLLPYIRGSGWLALGALFSLLAVDAANVLQPYLIKTAIDTNIAGKDAAGLGRTALLLGLTMICAFLFQALFNYGIQYLGQKLVYGLRQRLFGKVVSLSNDYFDRTPVGNTLTNLSNDVEALREFISEGIVSVLGDLLQVVFILAAMLLINPGLALITFATLPLFIVATILFRSGIRAGFREVRKANAEINVTLSETISGIREVHQFGTEKESRESFDASNRHYLKAYLRIVNAYALFFPAIEVVTNVSMILILLFAHFAIGTRLHAGEIFAFFVYINMFFWPLRQLAEKFNLLQSAIAATERIFTLLDEKASIVSPEPGADGSALPVPGTRKAGEVVFDNVSFHYSADAPVIRGISLRIAPGEKVAVVGPTGSGKTTLGCLISRLYDVKEGSILLDGRDVRSIPLSELRSSVATVPQDVFLFTGTVAENISLYHPAVDWRLVEHAAREVRANRFIANLPKGYAEEVREEGKRLSEGQKQLLGLARAFARNPSLVILDEATSNIDSETEHLIEDGIAHLLSGRTAIIIAHRLSTIRSVDRILVMQHGRIVEQGTHEELLRQGGLYFRLYEMQSLMLAK